MEVIALDEPIARAVFTRKVGTGTRVTALADSGASHILLQASTAHILRQVEYSRENDPPFAELKAANHGVLTAIGRGILSVSGLAVMAFIFADCDLANNFLGLVPFANLGCTGVFKPRTFLIYKEGDPTPILAGTRTSLDSLWQPKSRSSWITTVRQMESRPHRRHRVFTLKRTLYPCRTTSHTCDLCTPAWDTPHHPPFCGP
jgi:hypothetical protein